MSEVSSNGCGGDALSLSVVMPVYNEADVIEDVLRNLEVLVKATHETIVVYDTDEDTTVPVVQGLLGELPSVRLHRNEFGRGALLAIRSGMEAASGRFVLVMMSDGSDDPSDIDKMVELGLQGAAVVAASRYVRGGAQIGGPRLKGLASRSAGLILYYLGGFVIHDPTNNFKLYARSFLETATIESQRGFELGLELTVKAKGAGLSLAEVPTLWRDRTSGESQFDLRKLLPGYLRWFTLGLALRLGPTLRQRVCPWFSDDQRLWQPRRSTPS